MGDRSHARYLLSRDDGGGVTLSCLDGGRPDMSWRFSGWRVCGSWHGSDSIRCWVRTWETNGRWVGTTYPLKCSEATLFGTYDEALKVAESLKAIHYQLLSVCMVPHVAPVSTLSGR